MQVELTRDNRYVFTVTQRFTKKLQGRKQQCTGYDQPMVEIEHREKHVGNGPAAGDQDHPGIG
jgi:hypothetical protein